MNILDILIFNELLDNKKDKNKKQNQKVSDRDKRRSDFLKDMEERRNKK